MSIPRNFRGAVNINKFGKFCQRCIEVDVQINRINQVKNEVWKYVWWKYHTQKLSFGFGQTPQQQIKKIPDLNSKNMKMLKSDKMTSKFLFI